MDTDLTVEQVSNGRDLAILVICTCGFITCIQFVVKSQFILSLHLH